MGKLTQNVDWTEAEWPPAKRALRYEREGATYYAIADAGRPFIVPAGSRVVGRPANVSPGMVYPIDPEGVSAWAA